MPLWRNRLTTATVPLMVLVCACDLASGLSDFEAVPRAVGGADGTGGTGGAMETGGADAEGGTSPGDGGAFGMVTPCTSLTDDFDDGFIDSGRWITETNAASVEERNGGLVIDLPNVASLRSATLRSAVEHPVQDCAITVVVRELFASDPGEQIYLAAATAAGDALFIGVTEAFLVTGYRVGDAPTELSRSSWDQPVHRYWAITIDESARARWLVSTDGTAWQEIATIAPLPFSASSFSLVLGGTSTAATNGAGAILDNFNIVP